MAFLYINEYSSLGRDSQGSTVLAGPRPALVNQPRIPIGGAPVLSAQFSSATQFIEVRCDAACSIACGPAPVANVLFDAMGAGERLYFPVTPGHFLSVIANT